MTKEELVQYLRELANDIENGVARPVNVRIEKGHDFEYHATLASHTLELIYMTGGREAARASTP